ncbi:MAG: PIN domain-containing protein [Deltaproteobacteria bacterium]|nr:PIN domain-containing protein [Deltaproteobacteria bacterium]
MSDVLVDTSVWIDFFRGDRQAVARLDPLLRDDRAAVSGPIVAEVTSGARTPGAFQQLRARLGALATLEPPPDLWDRVAAARFSLARQGTQAHLVDLLIALTASTAGHTLLTRDRDFSGIAQVVPLDVELF